MVKSETKTTERAQWGREKVPRRGEKDVEEGDGEYYGKSKRGFVLGRKKKNRVRNGRRGREVGLGRRRWSSY